MGDVALAEAELKSEQKYFDSAVAARELSAAGWKPDKWSGVSPAERRAFKRSADKRAFDPNENVAFGRMDLDDGETYYIGKTPIYDDARNLLVIPWQTEVAAAFNRATPQNPCGLVKKRTFDVEANRLRHFNDAVFADIAAAVAELDNQHFLSDELLDSLQSARNGEMADIVQTIQAAQDKIVRAPKDQLLIVQGGPGTGKTAVALHRVSWLLFNHQDDLIPEDVLIVGPNPTFTRYIRKVLPALGDQNVAHKALTDMLADGIGARGTESDALSGLKGSARMADLLYNAVYDRLREPEQPVRIRRRNTNSHVELAAESIRSHMNRLKGEAYNDGRSKMREAFLELSAPQLSARGMQATPDMFDRDSFDGVIERIWPRLSPQQFLRELFGSKERLLRAGRDILSASEVELLHRPMADKVGDEPWTSADLALLDEATEIIRSAPDLYGHIVIDEAQDLSDMQIMAIRRRSRNGSFTVVGDIAQSTGAHAVDSWERLQDGLKSSLPSEVVNLEHGYRVPSEVFDIARPVLEMAAPGIRAPHIVRSVGAFPKFSGVEPDELADELVNLVGHHSGRGRFVGVIAAENRWPDLQERFRAEEISWGESTSGELSQSINLVRPADAKGLEFDSVIVVDPQEILDELYGARLLYIALTRTTTRLDVLYPAGSLPEVLGGTPTLVDDEQQSEPKLEGSPENDGEGNELSGSLARSKRVIERPSRGEGSGDSLSRVERRMVQAAAEELMMELESVPMNLREHVVAELILLTESS
ncbi:UvrD-helicase domain-containing protein [Arthrobacter sp. H5]|uniref:HelD family protein n=1 Tax=Arthrobacter sp. H5 TaxID=1267973 RepID=UPI0004879880|nr:UvrD-helicase domain-containing protein [Arthrobacter sp. H5]